MELNDQLAPMPEVSLLRVWERACLVCAGNDPPVVLSAALGVVLPNQLSCRRVPKCTQDVIDVLVAFGLPGNWTPHTQQLAQRQMALMVRPSKLSQAPTVKEVRSHASLRCKNG
jgi:hypothetical protein